MKRGLQEIKFRNLLEGLKPLLDKYGFKLVARGEKKWQIPGVTSSTVYEHFHKREEGVHTMSIEVKLFHHPDDKESKESKESKEEYVECPICLFGSGVHLETNKTCHACNGSGRVTQKEYQNLKSQHNKDHKFVTLNSLKGLGACSDAQTEFLKQFGQIAQVNEKNVSRAIDLFGVKHVVYYLNRLHPQYLKLPLIGSVYQTQVGKGIVLRVGKDILVGFKSKAGYSHDIEDFQEYPTIWSAHFSLSHINWELLK